MPEVDDASLSSSADKSETTSFIAERYEAMKLTPTSAMAQAEDTRGDAENHAEDRTLDGPTGARNSIGEIASKGEGLVTLEEAVDDGTVVKTAGTLVFSALEVSEMPSVVASQLSTTCFFQETQMQRCLRCRGACFCVLSLNLVPTTRLDSRLIFLAGI